MLASSAQTITDIPTQAPDILLKRCSTIDMGSNGVQPLEGENLEALTSTQLSMANSGQRVLLLAKRMVSIDAFPSDVRADRNLMADAAMACNNSLTVIGLVGLLDPPRVDTAHTVKVCRRAGIRFVSHIIALSANSRSRFQ